MKINLKIMLPALLLLAALVACEKSPVKRDYDSAIDSSKTPRGLVANDAVVWMNKVKMSGKCPDNSALERGIIYCIDTLVDKYGSIEDALLAGVINEKYIVQDTTAAEYIELVVGDLQPKHEYYYAIYAVNQNGIAFSDPILFKTTGVAQPLLDVSGTTKQETWEESFSFIDKDGDGQQFKFATKDSKNGLCSYSWELGKTYKPDNLIVTKKLDIGFDMNIDYQIYPSTKGNTYADKFALLISNELITADNCDKAFVLDSLRFTADYKLDSVRKIVKTLPIPVEYEFSDVYIAVRHFESTNQSGVFVETLKVY